VNFGAAWADARREQATRGRLFLLEMWALVKANPKLNRRGDLLLPNSHRDGLDWP
jgi:hypothetical protein